MACSCKHNSEAIEAGYRTIDLLRDLFIRRMTVDSETQDARRREFNQAIFHYESDEDVERWNERLEADDMEGELMRRLNMPKKKHGRTYQVWNEMDMDMVLRCFDNAVKDWRRTWCDEDTCRRGRKQ